MKNKQIRLFVADVDNTLRGIHEELFVKGQNSMTIAPALTKHSSSSIITAFCSLLPADARCGRS